MASEEDRKKAREIVNSEFGSSQEVLLAHKLDRLVDAIVTALTAARAEQRETLARVCDQRADQASINETEFDSIGERDLLPSVKFWEGQRVALQEFAAAIRAGKE